MGFVRFKVTRQPAILVKPSLQTPREILYLSNIDDQKESRFHVSVVLFYEHNPLKIHQDPAKVIREALSKVLVHYYPFAGRLREAPSDKLEVDCTGEGVLFVEADADLALHDFGDLQPPLPFFEELLDNVPGSQTITDSPLVLIQLTRLRCKGFVSGVRWNHCMADGTGMVQFLNAVAEMAKGASLPSVPPIWKREILRPRLKPTVSFPMYEDDGVEKNTVMPEEEEETRENPFFFGPQELAGLKRQGGSNCTTFEALSAFLWRSRTRALDIPADQNARLHFSMDVRSRLEPTLPQGYYGNVFVGACAQTKAGILASKPLGFAVELISRAKAMVNNEYVRSVVDFAELKSRGHFKGLGNFTGMGNFVVSDLTKMGIEQVDFGWKKAAYGGPARAALGIASFLIPVCKRNGTRGVVVPVRLHSQAMERFRMEMRKAVQQFHHLES